MIFEFTVDNDDKDEDIDKLYDDEILLIPAYVWVFSWALACTCS
ncbi:hypothetical protein AGMMS49531_01640 [Endomicrobiia bacterium]|nr:hypothetical protein AGMMS49531_01640 [Endomicrobiia bacterium]